MTPTTAMVLIILAFVALSGAALWIAYLLVMTQHPVFAVLAGVFAAASVTCAGSVEVKSK